MQRIKVISLLILIVFLSSCSNTQDDNLVVLNNGVLSTDNLPATQEETKEEELVLYSAKKKREVEGLKVEVEYHSSAMKFQKEYGELDSSNFQYFEEYSDLEFYTLKLSYKQDRKILESKDIKIEYTKAVQYLTDDVRNDLGIETKDNGIIKPELIVFERTYGIKPYLLINLVFDKNKVKNAKRFVYFDKLFGKGFIKLEFTTIEDKLL